MKALRHALDGCHDGGPDVLQPRVGPRREGIRSGVLAYGRELLAFVERSPSSYHCVAEAARMLGRAGFSRLDGRDGRQSSGVWPGAAGFRSRGGSLLAWRVGCSPKAGFRIVAAHTDSPALKLKPHWVKSGYGSARLDVDVYGRVLLHTWLDRDLGVAGRVVLESSHGLTSRLVRSMAPVCCIPSLAIHLAPDVNTQGLLLNPHLHLAPLVGQDTDATGSTGSRWLGAALGIEPGCLRGHDLSLYDTQPGQLGGLSQEYLHASRLDDQSMCFAALRALLEAPERPRATCIVALFDHEEVGSVSAAGSRGPALEELLSELSAGRKRRTRSSAKSALISADTGHALHPNFPERHDERHAPRLNRGPIVKTNVSRRYATDATSGAMFRQLCRESGVPYQEFVNRADLACGSTLGPELAARLGMDGVDVGAPLLGMHSIRETAGVNDQYWMLSVLRSFFARTELP